MVEVLVEQVGVEVDVVHWHPVDVVGDEIVERAAVSEGLDRPIEHVVGFVGRAVGDDELGQAVTLGRTDGVEPAAGGLRRVIRFDAHHRPTVGEDGEFEPAS